MAKPHKYFDQGNFVEFVKSKQQRFGNILYKNVFGALHNFYT